MRWTRPAARCRSCRPAGFRTYRIPDGVDLKSWPIYADVLSCDVLIDVPIAKDHGATRLTLGGKNLLGVILDAGEIHSNIGQRTADLVSVCRPTLTVVDAFRVLTANGPTGGDLNDVERLDTVLASADIVAADAYAATLFDLTGADIPYVQAAYDMGLGEMDLDKVDVRRSRSDLSRRRRRVESSGWTSRPPPGFAAPPSTRPSACTAA